MAKIAIVAEAWGAKEDMMQHALVGSSGAELARMMAVAQLAPAPPRSPSEYEMIRYWRDRREKDGIIIGNVFNERPLGNQIDNFFAGKTSGQPIMTDWPDYKRGKYLLSDKVHHVLNLYTMLEREKPNLVIALGATACWALLGKASISALRGTVAMMKNLNLKVLPTFHPAAVLRQWNLRPIVITDLEKAKVEAEFANIERIKRWLTVEPTIEEIEEWCTRPAEFYAVDIENPSIKVGATYRRLYDQIAMVGFARAYDDAIVIPFFDDSKPTGSYWERTSDEVRAWRLAQRLLHSPVPKLFQNGIYDLSHLIRRGFRPVNCRDDTMLLHHSLYPEMLKGLGFLGSIYSREIAWKTMSGKGNNLKRDE